MNSRVYVDGVRPPAGVPKTAGVQAVPNKQRMYFKPQTAAKENKILKKLQLPMLLLAGMTGGFFADNLPIGLALAAGYGVLALVTRIPSRTTFTLALVLLSTISLMLLFKPSALLIRNFATYAFVLLLVGVIALGREARMPKRMPRKYRR